jgi:predicted RNase H-like nuclease (RuvC/YqgF family)
MHWKRDYEDISEAADEIERLQAEMDTDHVQHMLNIKRKDAEIERLKAELFTMRNVFHQQDAKIERLEAWEDEHSRTEGGECPYCEIDRLRAVLEQIANLRPGYRFPDARDIAIETLREMYDE